METTNNYQKSENRETISKSLLAILMIVMFTVIGEPLIVYGEKADYND